MSLKETTENLYAVFSVYPRKPVIDGCPCCVHGTDKEKIHSKALNELDEQDLSRYAFKAMTTWGNSEDFRHYLPRIFELLATTGFIVDTFIILGKLEYGKWREWPQEEQEAVEAFLFAWWNNLIRTKAWFDKEAFIEIAKLTGKIDVLLSAWKISFEDNSFSNYLELVYNGYPDLKDESKNFKELDNADLKKLIRWIEAKSPIFEKAFFHYEKDNPELAESISETLYIYESVKKANQN